MTQSVSLEMRDNIAIVWIDNPPVNALSHHVRSGIVEKLKEATDAGASAAIVAGRGGTFIAGADIREFGKPPIEPMLPEVCNIIEATTIPVIAVIEGNTLGGGLETALGCHYRVATDHAKVGLPEVSLGILPGAAGTQRGPRAIKDPLESVRFVSSGRPVSGKQAMAMGLVDRTADDPLAAAIELAGEVTGVDLDTRRLSKVQLPWNDDIDKQFEEAFAQVAKQAKGAIAPLKAAECVRDAFKLEFDDGLKRERESFMELVQSDQSKALRHIFFAERAAAKAPKGITGTPRDIKKVGVIGAGTMGGGISMTYIEAGFPVVLLEMSDEALDRGLATIEKNWMRGVKSGRTTEEQVMERMSRYTRTTSYDDLADCDLIIEAVFETMQVKRDVFGKLDKIAKPTAILASNTSYLNVDEIAAETSRPENVLGMHYFSPANIMKLLEIVHADKTADDVLVTILDIAKKTRKQPVISGVGHGFIGNRMLTPYIRQANLLVLEGASPEQVDKALTDFGWAMGVFAVSDLAGLDIGYKSRADQNLSEAEANIYTVADRLVEAGHLGQKSGSGFYSYDPETRARTPNPEAMRILDEVRAERGINTRDISDEEIIERTQYALANEGAHVLGEGVARSAGDIDVVYNYGYGYPRWRGGPMKYIETVGLDAVADKIKSFTDGPGGVHWQPSDYLQKVAASGDSFADHEKK
jgi:3-hydroxyacyl-CoA dehydrogenase